MPQRSANIIGVMKSETGSPKVIHLVESGAPEVICMTEHTAADIVRVSRHTAQHGEQHCTDPVGCTDASSVFVVPSQRCLDF